MLTNKYGAIVKLNYFHSKVDRNLLINGNDIEVNH